MEEIRQCTVIVHDVSPVCMMPEPVAMNGSRSDSLANFRYLCLQHCANTPYLIH